MNKKKLKQITREIDIEKHTQIECAFCTGYGVMKQEDSLVLDYIGWISVLLLIIEVRVVRVWKIRDITANEPIRSSKYCDTRDVTRGNMLI